MSNVCNEDENSGYYYCCYFYLLSLLAWNPGKAWEVDGIDRWDHRVF